MNLTDYLSLFPGASREKPRFTALAETVLRQAADLMALTGAIPAGFSFGAAEGAQLDDLAAASGLTRETGMTDEAFRAFCLAKLSLWTWDGTNAGVPAALSALPGVTEEDNMDGTVTVRPEGTREDLLPVTAGIRMI